jgi:FkbM family methyltransferase
MKIFLDVGSNRGQTLDELLEPRHEFDRIFLKYGFDRVYCFEPVPELQQVLANKYRDPRIAINEAGLWNQTCERPIFSPGTQSASIFADKVNVDPQQSVICRFVRASDWFRDHLTEADEIYLKLNCEGCEVDIIEDLLDSNEYRKVTSLGVAFDVKKIPSQCGREIEITHRLEACGYRNYMDIELKLGDSRKEKMEAWLLMAGADRRSLANRVCQTVYRCEILAARVARYLRHRLRRMLSLGQLSK